MTNPDEIDISGLDKTKLIFELWTHSHVQGLSVLSEREFDFREVEARIAGGNTYFDYLFGRVMKVDVSGDTMETYLYDRDCGHGKAAAVVAIMRAREEETEPPSWNRRL